MNFRVKTRIFSKKELNSKFVNAGLTLYQSMLIPDGVNAGLTRITSVLIQHDNEQGHL